MLEPATDYDIRQESAEALKSIARMQAADRYAALMALGQHCGGSKAIISLFAQFIGLANRVVDNNREMAELLLITEGNVNPYTAEKINLPTIIGALEGIGLADGIDSARLCAGCAFRLGTPANQSPCTTADADDCGHVGENPFLCHEGLDCNGAPTHACRGFAQLRAQRKSEYEQAEAIYEWRSAEAMCDQEVIDVQTH